MSLRQRFSSAWNAFLNRDPTEWKEWSFNTLPVTSYIRPDRPGFTNGRDRSIITAILNRIAVDCSQTNIQHVRVNDDGFFTEVIKSPLNDCLSFEANIDQTGKAFMLDVVISLLDEGVVACVPIDTDRSTITHEIFSINTMRTGKIIEWYPNAVKVEVYNEHSGRKENLIVPKATTAIIENPFYSVMNEPNSTLQRLNRKLNTLDIIDDHNSSSKLDIIIQLPYIVKSEQQKKQAEERRQAIESQLVGSKYGIAYTDGTEKITQLNRPVENQIMTQVEYLTNVLYSQLGISDAILKGTASPEEMNNYFVHTIEPIMDAIVEELSRKFISKTARTQGQTIKYFRPMFKMLPLTSIAEIADKFTRNEIMTANEIRQEAGLKPSSEPGADDLRNKNNIATPNFGGEGTENMEGEPSEEDIQAQLDELDENDKNIQEMENMLKQADASAGRIITSRE